ncbi:hypothetical protein [Planktothrix mougeotii]|uniref:Uncharacterized protein n=1 Tax=Planktothrix mougeotii LEGE 06226 TaxID=1828728 RepID=A0ABR9UEX9_9CYAN|nr:hypothetical protein [Planktothrix mougeotii]MBE9145025.1 hypothetical protein [Planktothrix mougeotii LEGE 06226]
MGNFLIFSWALVLVLLGQIAHFLMPTGLSATEDLGMRKYANLISIESTDSNAVEVDGIRFEILMPQRELTIPAKIPGAHTPVQLGIEITNNTQILIRFPPFDPLFAVFIEIVGADGKPFQKHWTRAMLLKSEQAACPLVKPGQSTIFFLDAKLFWQNNKLLLGGSDGLGGSWYFDHLKPGDYQARFTYMSARSVMPCYDPTTDGGEIIPGIWTGKASTPFVMFHLVQF